MSTVAGPATRDGSGDMLVSACLVGAGTLAAVTLDARLWHWFVVPVAACGVLIGADVVAWLRGRLDTFDPRGVLAVLGFHFFYLAPLLHVLLDYWPTRIVPSVSWPDALGTMAVLNVAGLILYRWVVALPGRSAPPRARFRVRLDERRFVRIVGAGVAIGMLAFVVVVLRFGGVLGFLATVTSDREALTGLGWLLMTAEMFPMLIFVLIVVHRRRALAGRPELVLLLLAGFALVQFLVGGLRGSRSNTVWPVLLGLMLVHLLVARVSRKALVIFALVFGSFMYIYGLYKSAGTDVLDIARGTRTVAEVSAETGRDVPTMLLGDLGRSDIQAIVLDRKRQGQGDLGYGRSYVGDVLVLVPNRLLPERPPSKAVYGTEVLMGVGAYDHQASVGASRIYGIAGEAMLNFGPLGAVLSFGVLGLVIRGAQRLYRRARYGDELGPKILAPALCLASVLTLTSDLDNVVVMLVTRFLPVGLAALLACAVVRQPPAATVVRPRAAASPVARRNAR
ncbi:hypothetical protein [Jidongwangia harbinensis]|uniref:hypothetical protein n=1 Tax=Jidongwangia harbinensis TaxID=2878561 RepID=UPI001CD97217|nr:hypothetical protein [Jidongwangia harbinensis]MCA2214076.1 hypothetical protein [Jidongwangia harbinensis]